MSKSVIDLTESAEIDGRFYDLSTFFSAQHSHSSKHYIFINDFTPVYLIGFCRVTGHFLKCFYQFSKYFHYLTFVGT